MKEKDFQSLFTKWVREHPENNRSSTVWELKICKTGSLPLSRIEEHQITKLTQANEECVYHKISDQAQGFKPFDALQVCKAPAYLVILFYKPRQKKVMYWIHIQHLLQEIKESKRKSLTEERTKQIATYIYEL